MSKNCAHCLMLTIYYSLHECKKTSASQRTYYGNDLYAQLGYDVYYMELMYCYYNAFIIRKFTIISYY